jgi:hypothetical protein
VATALDVVDDEVRELIRRRGLDPFIDPGSVRLLVRDVVADYSERSLTSALPPIGDAEAVHPQRHMLPRDGGHDDIAGRAPWVPITGGRGSPAAGASAASGRPTWAAA